MNLLICKEEWRIAKSNRFSIQDPQKIQHICNILNKREGARLKAGLIDASLGKFILEKIESNRIVGIYKPILVPIPRFPEVHILLAINRPPTVRKILQLAGTWGVSSIHFFVSRNSRREYLTSPVWNSTEIESELLEGMEQGKNIFLPKIHFDFKNRSETILLEKFKKVDFTFRFVLDRRGATLPQIIEEKKSDSNFGMPSKTPQVLVAIGPESGFVRNEIDFWKHFGFKELNLSSRVLRTETAVAFLLSRLEEKNLFLKT
ncbi:MULTISPECIES: 16S rRNA (uracil(1498)-N(3))-methyltransferase [Leptospira]|uniref:Ribosomal RNA small subunit methyltransferase E n=4 Tax=Leptospira borgpetersenii TaxID=174 RepID=A0A0E3B1V7_LEPBO|nr:MULTISPECIES: 16S rRNA (uracil(1498)-N(3))-methyltransferase [Leptospira]EMO08286.1 RNA methyltransferase, RsmE family [Leptospira borgpetersenii str. Noumea 25]ALO25437.1 RNA methyltransferase, RsmE family [Leptospira borgpetersenii serovar Ballum]ANH00353.1 Ribosomal RNA small subunit methyltransferase E [Leptospira borgpetersenii str. 4E]AXX15778.1 16S rRNA (uracil(1498)-N(3))-methyltransferase [Leptospira borgpetersenii serovar Ceylonica]EKP13978.1 RNA methyltransferase, RsmE family [Le